jgi:hypothetical protein
MLASQTFELPATNWKVSGGAGYRYRDPLNLVGPVTTAAIRRTTRGHFTMKVSARGAGLTLLPPNPGSTGIAVLTTFSTAGPRRYCVFFGDLAGGVIDPTDVKVFKIVNPTAEVECP